jgi:hypothetical protein
VYLGNDKVSDQANTIDYDQKYRIGQQAKATSVVAGIGTAHTACDKNAVKRNHWNIGHSGRKHNGTDHTACPGHNFGTETHTIAVPVVLHIGNKIVPGQYNVICHTNPSSTARL